MQTAKEQQRGAEASPREKLIRMIKRERDLLVEVLGKPEVERLIAILEQRLAVERPLRSVAKKQPEAPALKSVKKKRAGIWGPPIQA